MTFPQYIGGSASSDICTLARSNDPRTELQPGDYPAFAQLQVNLRVRHDASNPFSRSFMILSLGLLADDASQACTLAMLTV